MNEPDLTVPNSVKCWNCLRSDCATCSMSLACNCTHGEECSDG